MMIPISFRGFPLNDDGLRAAFARSYQRPGVSPIRVTRQGASPVTTAVEIPSWQLPELGMLIDNAADEEAAAALRLGLLTAFDTRSGPGALIVADEDGENLRYIYAVCRELAQKAGEGGDGFVATLEAADDQYWRSMDVEQTGATITGSPSNVVVNNGGHLDAYPLIIIHPTSTKENVKWAYRRCVIVRWTGASGATNYPVQVWAADTTALTPAKAADETSVGLHVNGVEVDRWFAGANGSAGGFDSGTTRMWSNFDFEAGQQATLATGISDGGVLGIWANRIEVTGDISGFPPSGLLEIDGELFRYRGKDNARGLFLDVTREYGPFAAHSAGDSVYWIQHEVFITYSFLSGVAAAADDSRKPLMDLFVSTNAVHHWNGDFGSSAEPNRPGQWYATNTHLERTFTGDEDGPSTDPFEVIGSSNYFNYDERNARWQYHVPNGVSSVSIYTDLYGPGGAVRVGLYASATGGGSWRRIDAAEMSDVTWDTELLSGGSLQTFGYYHVSFFLTPSEGTAADVRKVQATAATIGITDPPIATVLPERTNYSLDLTINNLTLHESIRLNWPVGLSSSGKLFIDCETEQIYTRYDTGDDDVFFFANVYRIMSKSSHRLKMLRLAPGSNIIQFSEDGLTGMDVTIEWRERVYI